jgi:hypothetical protein
MLHDWEYQRPILSRYSDPLELIWLSCCHQLQLHVRRDPDIFSMTDGTGLLALGPRKDLDPDDTVCQMVFHELCHWITNGLETFSKRDWGFPLDAEMDEREHACQRLQAALADPHGLRDVMAPTGIFRQYYDQIPEDPFEARPDAPEWEAEVIRLAKNAYERARRAPFEGPIQQALEATGRIRQLVQPFMSDYQTELEGDPLPSWWDPSRVWRVSSGGPEGDAT